MTPPGPARGRGGGWRDDPLWPWMVYGELVALTIVVAVLISIFGRSGFWPWIVMFAAIVLGWIVAAATLIPRSASDR